MQYDFRLIRGEDFLRLDAKGNLDEQATRRLIGDLLHGIAHAKMPRVLLDMRKAINRMTAAQVLAVAHLCQEISPDPGDHRVAMLGRVAHWDRAEMIAKIAAEGGWNIKVFDDFEQAFEWLVGAEKSLVVMTMDEGVRGTGHAGA